MATKENKNPEKKDKKYEEPFPPERTPPPPQNMDPSKTPEQEEREKKADAEKSKSKPQNQETEEKNPAEKRLGESKTEIDDKTTI